MRISCIHAICAIVFMFYFVHTVSIVIHTWCTYSDVFLLTDICSKNVRNQPTQRLTKNIVTISVQQILPTSSCDKGKIHFPYSYPIWRNTEEFTKDKKLRKYIWASTQGFLIPKSKLFRSQFLLNKLSAVYMWLFKNFV